MDNEAELDLDIDYQQLIEEPFIKGLLRIIILASLREGGKQGYHVYRYVVDKIKLRIGLSTVYTLLQELSEKGFITKIKNIYHLTEKGVKALNKFLRKYGSLSLIL